MRRSTTRIALATLCMWAHLEAAYAQALDAPVAPAPAARPGQNPAPTASPPHHTDSPTEVRLGARLRCPVCQGMSIGDSPSPMAQDMMKQVRRMYAEGTAEVDIVSYFTDRYGTWVLLDPPKRGFALWAWLLPPAGLIAGIVFVISRSLAANKSSAPPPAESANALSAEDRTLLSQVRQQVEN